VKFLGKAKRFLQDLGSEPETKTQYFNVLCASGHRVRGERTEGYQALRCPACGEGVFVLPRSPLPEPAPPPRPTSARRSIGDGWVDEGPVELTDPARVSVEIDSRESREGDAEIIWDDPPVESRVQTAPNRGDGRGRKAATGASDPAGAATAKSARPSATPATKRVPRDDAAPVAGPPPPGTPLRDRKKPKGARPADREGDVAAERDESRLTERQGRRSGRASQGADRAELAMALHEPAPERTTASRKRLLHRALFVLVPLLIVLTVGWRYRQSRLAELPLIAELGRTEGIPALDDGNFDKAFQRLSAAKAAVDALGGAVEGADEIRDAADEAAIWVKLIPTTLEELLAEAGRTEPDAWADRFKTLYQGRSIIIDSWITAEADPSTGSAYDILYRVLPPGQPSNFVEGGGSRPDRVATIDFSGFVLFEQVPPKAGNRVTFGARLAAFEYDRQTDEWKIRLEPKSGVFITHTKALESIGWRSGSEAKGLTKDQP
jgi:hypothetical protein